MSPVEIAVGFFDGIHIGHRRIFSAMLSRAAEKGARSIAMTFINHPREVFSPDKAPKLLMSSIERIEGIKKQGVDEVVAEEFVALSNEEAVLMEQAKYFDEKVASDKKLKNCSTSLKTIFVAQVY